MRTYRIANTDLEVSRIALGWARPRGGAKEVVAGVEAALDQGINLFDHADIYGRGHNEEAFSVAWQEIPGLRDRIILQSKCGIRNAGDPDPSAPKRYDFSYEYIVSSVEGSLRRLKTDHLDVLALHRPDVLVEPEVVARAFDDLQRSGKVRYFGVSNHTGLQIELLRRSLRQPIVFDQMQVSAEHPTLFEAGVVSNQDFPPTPVRGDGTLEYCRLNGITIQAWSPLARGVLTAGGDESSPAGRVAAAAGSIARERGVTLAAILIAWLLRHPAKIQPIIGSTNPENIRSTCKADEIELTREEWYSIFTAARGAEVP